MKKFAVILLFLCFSALATAQEKIYTKKMRLADFSEKTTRVVLGGDDISKAIQEEVSLRWIFSPYEFCSRKDYETQKQNHEYSFITLEDKEGLLWLTLSMGGKEKGKNTDPLEEGFTILSFPVAPSEGSQIEAVHYMPAYIDILQRFISDAVQSDRIAYLGLGAYSKAIGSRVQQLSGEEARKAFAESRENAVVEISVVPSNPDSKSQVWHYIIGADPSHYPYHVSKSKWKNR